MFNKLLRITNLIRLRPFSTDSPEGRSNERYRRILINSGSSIVARIALTGLGLVIVPLVMDTFGKTKYGLWATITATTTWFTLFDFGIVNSLVNRVSEAHGKEDKDLAAKYTSTAFAFLLLISVVLIGLMVITIDRIPLRGIFNLDDSVGEPYLRLLMISAALPILISLPFTIVKQIYAGYQKKYVSNIVSVIASLLTILAVISAIKVKASLPIITVIFFGVPSLMLSVNLLYLSTREMPWLRIKLSNISARILKGLLKISIPLLLFQLGSLLVNQTQPIVLNSALGLDSVAEFSIVNRVYITFISIIGMSTNSFVPSFREANERGDRRWAITSFKRMLALRMIFALVCSILVISFGNLILVKWLRVSDISFPISLWLILSSLMIVSTWGSAFSDFLVIMDQIWIQVVLVILNGVSTIALTILLIPYFGISGAFIASMLFALLILSWLLPLLCKPFLQEANHE